jgi:L-aminopeptidase/D-esterase-like protein
VATGGITDVPGVLVGHQQGPSTGVTVLLVPEGAAAAVDVRGGPTGTRELDVLDPANLVRRVQAICLAGGGGSGLAAADGVVAWLAEHERGFPVGRSAAEVVPIVPTATIADLPPADRAQAPDAAVGYAACQAAVTGPVPVGRIGVGTGARLGSFAGAIGTAGVRLPAGPVVGALVVANALGEPVDADGELLAAGFAGVRPVAIGSAVAGRVGGTIAVVAVDVALDKADCRRLAVAGHDGLARAIRPAAAGPDPVTVFALATGVRPAPATPDGGPDQATRDRAGLLNQLGAAAADAVERAVALAVLGVNPADPALSPVGTRDNAP